MLLGGFALQITYNLQIFRKFFS